MIPDPVRSAFDLTGDPIELPGGVTGVMRFGDVVVKPVVDGPEAQWEQATFAALAPSANVRWARPIPATDGRWVVDGWIANEFIAALTPVAPRWDEVIEFGNRFHNATVAIPPPIEMLGARSHRWARGERHAFDEAEIALPREVAMVDDQLRAWCVPERATAQVVHVDLTHNVFLDAAGTPVVLDISPGYRTPTYCAAVVIADALVWSGADIRTVDALGGIDTARPVLARALRFRLATDHLSRVEGTRSDSDRWLEIYRGVMASLFD